MFKQIKFIHNYSTKYFKYSDVTYSILNYFSKRGYCTNNNVSTKTVCKSFLHTQIISDPDGLSKLENLAITRKRENLVDVLDVTNRECFDMVTECPKLKTIHLNVIKARIKMYSNNDITMSVLLKYPWLLTIRDNSINVKLNLIKKLPLPLNESICFLRQKHVKILKKMCDSLIQEYTEQKVNRMQLMAEKLQCPVGQVCYATAKYQFLLLIEIERIINILNILKSKNVPKEQILRDFWIFKYKPETIARRLNAAKDANVVNIRTWMVRCKADVYYRTLSRHSKNKQVLGNLPSITEYLSDRLNLNMLYAQAITEKHPEIRRMNITKAKNVIDYLFAEGYTAMHIIRSPRILCCKLETIQKRSQAFKEIGYTPTSLVIFCKSQIQFDKYYKIVLSKLEKNNNEIVDANQ